MTAVRMAWSELRRITAGRLPRLAVVALCLVPLLYGGLYLFANRDPYGKLDAVPVALIVEDTGAAGRTVGEDVARDLVDSHAFDWRRTDAADALGGVRDGRYTFALTIPADFSAALTSSSDFTPRQALLVLTTNDANGYLARTIAGQLTTKVHDAVAKQVGTEAADRFLTGFATIHDKLSTAADGAGTLADGAHTAQSGAAQLADGANRLHTGQQQLLDGATQLADGTGRLAEGARQLDSGAGALAGGLDQLRAGTRSLPADSAKLAGGAQQVADGNKRIADAGNQVAQASAALSSTLDDDLPARLRAAGLTDAEITQALAPLRQKVTAGNDRIQQVDRQLTQLSSGAQQVADGARKLADAAPQLASGIAAADDGAHRIQTGAHDLDTGAGQLNTGATQLRDGERTAVDGSAALATGAGQLATGTGQLATGVTQLRDGLRSGLDQIPDVDDPTRQATAQTIGDPLAVQDAAENPAANYGAGLAPFFLTLAAWIGAYVLFLLVQPLSRRAMAAGQTPLRVAIGGWLPAAVLGLAQMVALFAVVVFGIGIAPAHPVLTLGLMMLASLCFTAIVHALNAALGSLGQFLGLVLMVLQLVSSGGTFPWQTIPDVLHPLHVALPMSYAIDGMRHLLYGGDLGAVAADVGVLALWSGVAVLVAARAARTQRVWTVSRVKPELVL